MFSPIQAQNGHSDKASIPQSSSLLTILSLLFRGLLVSPLLRGSIETHARRRLESIPRDSPLLTILSLLLRGLIVSPLLRGSIEAHARRRLESIKRERSPPEADSCFVSSSPDSPPDLILPPPWKLPRTERPRHLPSGFNPFSPHSDKKSPSRKLSLQANPT